MKSRLATLLLICLTPALATATGCDQSSGERVLGDYRNQPPTVVTPLPGGTATDAAPAIASAKRAAAPHIDRCWPEPVSVVERPGQWEVLFLYREKRVLRDGEELVMSQLPGAMRVVVRKPDLTATIIPGL